MHLALTTPAALSRVWERVSSLNPTYGHIGVTLDPPAEMQQIGVWLGTGGAAFKLTA